jgi:hypothetical protein
MINPMWVVIDKSFLQQADYNELSRIISNGFRLLLTARIAYEIDTTDTMEERQRCLRALNVFKDNVDLIEEDGSNGLLGYEINEKKPSGYVLQSYIHSIPHNLGQYLQGINSSQWVEDFEKYPADDFKNIVLEIKNKVPLLNKDDLRKCNIVRDIYARLMNSKPIECIDVHWLIFRRIQVDGWMVLDRARVNDQNRLHDRIDSRVVDVALLTKGLATNDKLMKNIFKFFCPEGKLFSKELNGGICGTYG